MVVAKATPSGARRVDAWARWNGNLGYLSYSTSGVRVITTIFFPRFLLIIALGDNHMSDVGHPSFSPRPRSIAAATAVATGCCTFAFSRRSTSWVYLFVSKKLRRSRHRSRTGRYVYIARIGATVLFFSFGYGTKRGFGGDHLPASYPLVFKRIFRFRIVWTITKVKHF